MKPEVKIEAEEQSQLANERVIVDESLALQFEENVEVEPDFDIDEMTMGTIKKKLQELKLIKTYAKKRESGGAAQSEGREKQATGKKRTVTLFSLMGRKRWPTGRVTTGETPRMAAMKREG